MNCPLPFKQIALLLQVCILLTAGCATSQSFDAGDTFDTSFQPTGEIVFSGPRRRTGAAFDGRRVVGPGLNVHRNGDGSWSGFLQGRAVQLTWSPGRLDGASLSLAVEQGEAGLELRGHWSAQRSSEQIYLRVSAEDFFARGATGTPSVFLKRKGPGRYGGEFNGDYEVQLRGDALLPRPPEPQFALALLGAIGG